MDECQRLFCDIIESLSNATQGKLFGAQSIKSNNGKNAAFLWKTSMTFKLDQDDLKKALSIAGATIGSHLYNTEKKMKGWVSIPENQSQNWKSLTKLALDYVEKLK